MAKKPIVWTETAVRQRREILHYWTKRNGNIRYAEKLIKQISRRVELISDHPEAGKLCYHPDTREAAMGNFSIYYKVSGISIVITAFWDNRQDPKKLLTLFK